MSSRHADAHAEFWPRFGLQVDDGDRTPVDLDVLFGRSAPVVLEIGFGMGDATAAGTISASRCTPRASAICWRSSASPG
jgi:tRNA G46 methylase TrmB